MTSVSEEIRIAANFDFNHGLNSYEEHNAYIKENKKIRK